MGSFRRIEADAAGPTALGILIPPSRRTFVILRPRGLSWDLLLSRGGDDPTFRDLAHDEASAVAQSLFGGLRRGATVEAVPHGGGFLVRSVIGPFVLIACSRRPGQPYAPLICGGEEARAATERLTSILCPPDGVEQELYFNVRFFERPG
jgi:hypothetical protein